MQDIFHYDPKKRFQVALEAAELASFDWDIPSDKILWNKQFFDIFGVRVTSRRGGMKDFIKLIYESDRKYFKKQLTGALKSGSLEGDFRIIRGDTEEIRWIRIYGRVAEVRGKFPVRISGVLYDSTERHETEKIRNWLSEIVESSRDAILSFSTEGEILTWNRGAENMFGYKKEEAIGERLAMLVPYENMHEHRKFLELMRQGKSHPRVQTVQLAKGGRRVDVSLTASAIKDREGRVIGVTATFRDISDLKKTQDSLIASKEKYEAFIAHSSEGIYQLELEEPMPISLSVKKQINFIYRNAILAECNAAMGIIYGIGKTKSFVGMKLRDFASDFEEEIKEHIRDFIRCDYQLQEYVIMRTDKKGEKKYLINNVSAIIEHGKLLRVWGLQRDITEQKRIEKQKDEFMGIVTHELRTPVTSVKAYTQLLEKQLKGRGDNATAEVLGKVNGQLGRLSKLINDLLDVTKIEGGKLTFEPVTCDLYDLAKEIVDEVQVTTHKHKILLTGDTSAMVVCDRDRMGQVIMNLLTNAIKYSPDSRRIVANVLELRDKVQLSVEDFGLGIPLAMQDKIFKRFFRVSGQDRETYPGLGLGLYICKQIMTKEKGRIWVESKEGRGSKFIIELPKKKQKKRQLLDW